MIKLTLSEFIRGIKTGREMARIAVLEDKCNENNPRCKEIEAELQRVEGWALGTSDKANYWSKSERTGYIIGAYSRPSAIILMIKDMGY